MGRMYDGENEDDLCEGPTVVLRSVQVDDAFGTLQHPRSKFMIEGYIKRDVLGTLNLFQCLSDIVDADDKRRAAAQADAMADRAARVGPHVAPSTDPPEAPGPVPTSTDALGDPPGDELVARVTAALRTSGVYGVRVEPLVPTRGAGLRTVVHCAVEFPRETVLVRAFDNADLTTHYVPGIGLLVGVRGGRLQGITPSELQNEVTLCATYLIGSLPHGDIIPMMRWVVSLCPPV